MLHVIWKSKDVPRTRPRKELTPDEDKVRGVVKQQRDSLLEKLVEFAIGTQSNTTQGVKHAVTSFFQNRFPSHFVT